MRELLLKLDSVCKSYKSPTIFGGKPAKDVLREISLEVHRGECVGILGRNGAGKSSLLKVIDGATAYDSGDITRNGKVVSIIELSSNVMPNLTGFENAQLFFQMNGYSGIDLALKIDTALDYSELADDARQMAGHYSSGMRARLAFSLAINLDFDILLLDEVLAVGDFEFQQKCLSSLNRIKMRSAIVFVSHSVNTQRQFCDRGLVLDRGMVAFSGGIDKAIAHYLRSSSRAKQTAHEHSKLLMFGEQFWNRDKVTSVDIQTNKHSYSLHEKVTIRIEIEFNYLPGDLIIGLPIWDDDGRLITALNSDLFRGRIQIKNPRFVANVLMTCDLNPGIYHCVAAIVDGAEYLYRQPAFELRVNDRPRVFGYYTPMSDWNYET